jgi:serine/threonine-protein kinase
MAAEHNLLFGVLALQADFLDAQQFAEACSAWASRKDTPLADLLVERGWLTAEQRAAVDLLLTTKLHKHGGDAHASLAAVATHEVRSVLDSIADADVRQSLADLTTHTRLPLPATVADETGSRQRYTLTRLHAQGGIGQVWLAHDEDLGRDVALKELRPDRSDSPTAVTRFLEEAKITGQLEHPGIVPVYELVRPREGPPCYAMRFVGGRTLADAIRGYHRKRQANQAGPLDLRELLTAFVGACNAVAYTHSRGVLHRDLKPTNVALGEYGEVLVLDWGLAKVLGQAEDPTSLLPVALGPAAGNDRTQQGQVLGTPSYMAPEQARGRPDLVDKRSDVYGLGAILYETLTGEPPFSGADAPEVLRRVVQEPVVPPRQRVPRTPPGLEAVCLKALAKGPEDRYPSARDLAQDVQRWLADEAVSAYRDPWLVRAGRRLRQHRTAVTAAATAVAVALASLGVATAFLAAANAQLRAANGREAAAVERARGQEQLAQQNFRLAREAVDKYITEVGDDQRLKKHDLSGLRRQLLQSAVAFYQRLARQPRGEDPRVRWEQARSLMRLGYLTQETASLSDAIGYYEQARDILVRLAEEQPGAAEVRTELATTYHCLGCLNRDIARVGPAEEAFRHALEHREWLAREDPSLTSRQADVAESYDNLGKLYWKADRPEQAKAAFAKARDLLIGLDRDHPEEPYYRYCLASAYNNLAMLEDDADEFKRAEADYGRARDLFARLVRDHADEADYQADAAQNLSNLGLFYGRTDRPKDAMQALRDAHDMLDKVARRYPSVTDYAVRLGGVDCNLGQALHERGDLPAAREWYTRVTAGLGDVLRKEPRHAVAREYLRNACWKRAEALAQMGRPGEAVADWDRAIELDNGGLRQSFRAFRAQALAASGKYASAAAEAADLARSDSLPGDILYQLGRVYSLASAGAQKDDRVSRTERDRQADQYAARAVELLRQAVAKGWKDVEHLKKDSDLDPLRGRDDFKKLMAEVKAGAPEKKP